MVRHTQTILYLGDWKRVNHHFKISVLYMQLVMGNLIYYFCQLPFKRKTLQHKKYFYFIDYRHHVDLYILYILYIIYTHIYIYIYIYTYTYIYIFDQSIFDLSLYIYHLDKIEKEQEKVKRKNFSSLSRNSSLKKMVFEKFN